MLHFRAPGADRIARGTVNALIADVLRPCHFFVGPPLTLEWLPPAQETIPWEIFRGRLLGPGQTREQRTFLAWNIYCMEVDRRSGEPILSVKLDEEERRLHVVRALECHAWEGYDAGGNVYLSREVRKWLPELVGTIPLDSFRNLDHLHDELICLLFQAVVGTSRLPVTSVEAPLPAFSFGRLAYAYRPGLVACAEPMTSWRDFLRDGLHADLAWVEKARLLETLLRAAGAAQAAAVADLFAARWQEREPADSLIALVRTLFNEVSLSPYTGLVESVLAFLRRLEETTFLDTEQVANFLGHLLRQTGRHLSAYDLVTFHHFGANYPDALLLDAVLKAYLDVVERRPDLFQSTEDESAEERRRRRLRRRALRQGWLFRSRYEGHLVPDAPTSQGENARVLPATHPRVPEEQILNPMKRVRRLFAGAPLARHLGCHGRALLEQSVRDLENPLELRELGTALFLDRPLGAFKAPGEPDQTLLLSHVAFSYSLAERQLRFLVQDLKWLEPDEEGALKQRLRAEIPPGIELAAHAGGGRPGVVALEDACKVANDFVLLHTTAATIADLFRQYDFRRVVERFRLLGVDATSHLLVVRAGPAGGLALYDAAFRQRLELEVEKTGSAFRAGVEYLTGGLRVVRLWEEVPEGGLVERQLENGPVVLPPRVADGSE